MPGRWYEKAVEFGKLGRYNVALHCCNRALEVNQRDELAWGYKGMTLEKLGKHEEAIECFDKAIALDPHFADALLCKGGALVRLGKFREALPCLEEAHRLTGLPLALEGIRVCKEMLGQRVRS